MSIFPEMLMKTNKQGSRGIWLRAEFLSGPSSLPGNGQPEVGT